MALLLSGDVEKNPGPSTEEMLTAVLETVTRIESGQADMRSDLHALKHWQASVDVELQQLSSRIRALEVDTSSLKKNQGALPLRTPEAINSISEQIKTIESRCDDTENRLRRCNLLFFGIPDDSNETWSASEGKVIDVCSKELGVTIEPSQVDRAHRLGKYQVGKCRPIITKFAFFKDKQRVIEKGYKFKNTNFAVREDFSLQTRVARRKLIEFAKSKNVPFKPAVD